MIKSIFVFLLLFLSLEASPCPTNYHCKMVPGKETPELVNLTCTLPNMDTFTINAPNVLNSDGTLKKYFETKNDVCDVLGWFNYEIPYIKSRYPTLSKTVTQALTLDLSHLESLTLGGATVSYKIHLDTDIKDDNTTENTECYDPDFDDSNPNNLIDCKNIHKDQDGNIHKHRMKYIATHEFWHFVARNTSGGSEDEWVQEAPARNFEDVVYDGENPYLDPLFADRLYKKYELPLLFSNQTVTGMSYNGFLFYKLLDNKCSYPDMAVSLQEINDLSTRVNALIENCSAVPNIGGDKLAGAFVLYNYAMLFKKDIKLLDSNELSHPLESMFRGSYDIVDKPNFSENLDLKSYAGNSLPPFSAKSFLISHET